MFSALKGSRYRIALDETDLADMDFADAICCLSMWSTPSSGNEREDGR